MNWLNVYLFLFCVAICSCELMGPGKKYNDDKEKDDDENANAIDTDAKVNAEYLKDIKKVVNEQMEELKDYMLQQAKKSDKEKILSVYKELSGQKGIHSTSN